MSKHIASRAGVFVAAFAALALAAAPLAQADTPASGYEQFAGCQNPKTENPVISSCIHGVITGGHIRIAKKEVPFSLPIGLTGGTDEFLQNFGANAQGGLEPVKEPVPGGLLGSKLYAVTELAGQPQLFGREGAQMPIKVHLVNPLLGGSCYIGSNAHPIVLNLTSGTTAPPPPGKPLTGQVGTFGFDFETEILHMSDLIWVDNTFAVPATSGCALSLFGGSLKLNIDKLISAQMKLPSPAGANEVVQNLDLELVAAEKVYP